MKSSRLFNKVWPCFWFFSAACGALKQNEGKPPGIKAWTVLVSLRGDERVVNIAMQNNYEYLQEGLLSNYYGLNLYNCKRLTLKYRISSEEELQNLKNELYATGRVLKIEVLKGSF